jgi:hypothetical protein
MEHTNNREQQGEGIGLNADALRGRQSVRATFRLPAEMVSLLSVAASLLGLKQKSLFDQLVEDRQVLEQVAAGAEGYQPSADLVARTHGLPRDLLVELSISRLLPVLSAEQERQQHRKLVLTELEAYHRHGRDLLERARELLGDGDPAIRQLAALVSQGERAVLELRDQVERGRATEDYG